MPASPTNPCDSQLYKLQQEGTSKQDQHIDHLRNSKIWAEADTDYRYLRNSKIWAEADTAGARSDANIKTVINLRSDFDNQDTEKTPIVPKTVTDKGVKSLAPRPETKIPKINQTCEDRVSETLNRNHLKSQDDVVPFIYNVVYGQGLIVTVNLKDECLIRFVEDRSLPPFRSKQVFEQLTQSCRVKLQGGKYIAHQPDNRISVIPERNHLTCDLKIQFDVSFIDNVVYWQRLIVTINLKDECLIRLVEDRSLPPFRSKQVFEQLTQSCRVNNGDTNIGADEVSHVVKKTYGERNNKDGCPVKLEEVRSLNRTCIRFYGNTFFEQLMKSCRGVLKGIDVKCFLLVMVFIHLAVASPLERVCLVSNDLVVTPSGPLQVGKRMKLICRHNCYQGTPRWDQDRPIGSKLTFNGDVLPPHKQTIDLEINENEYNIIFPNVTFTDINSTYSCHYSFVLTQISPIEYYKVLPTIESISKQSVYENNVLNGTLEFKEVYPLPECVLYCDDKRQKEIPICETCKTWERDFFKVKFTFNIDLNNKNCREENVSVRCAVGRENYKYDFSKLPKNKENNEATAGISVGVIIGVLVGFAVLGTILYKLYKHGAFRRCQRDRNEENPEGIQLKSEHSPDCGNDSQNISQENNSLLQEEALNLSDTYDSNGQISKQCYQSNEISGETENGRFRETLNQIKQKQQEMHSDGLKNSKTVAKIANTKPGVNNESTSVQSGHNAVNSCKECNGTGQMPQSPDDVAIPEHCDRRKSEDQSTSLRAIGSELNDTKSKTEILLENTNVKASEKISSSDVPNLHADFSFSGDFAGINPNRNAEEE